MGSEKMGKERVAIVGTGMAGLVAANLLYHDRQHRYECVLFEQGSKAALDAASITIQHPRTGKQERIDLPMRAFAGGYYTNLRAMYDFFKIPYHAQRFNFSFSQCFSSATTTTPESTPHFIHSSNLHRLPPPRPTGVSLMHWILEIIYVLCCYVYFTTYCFRVAPTEGQHGQPAESLDEYFRRIHLPRRFVDLYLAPLLSSVATCSHEELLRFPASDVVDYKRRTNGAEHFVVSSGVQSVQDRLIAGLDIRFNERVTAISQLNGKLHVQTARNSPSAQNLFDKVILAIPPNAATQIYPVLQHTLSRIPTRLVESAVYTRADNILTPSETLTQATLGLSAAQSIHLRTTSSSNSTSSEALHVQSSGHVVATRIHATSDSAALYTSTFPRVLRTVESRAVVQALFADRCPSKHGEKVGSTAAQFKSGDAGVYLVGGWAWDGMVLLEGCVVSAMRVARALGVEVPWAPLEVSCQ